MVVFWLLVGFTLIVIYSPQVHSTDDSIYQSELNQCLDKINSIPMNRSAPFVIKKVKNHIELVVNRNGKFDYYEMIGNGSLCYAAVDLNEIPLRTEQTDCDNSQKVDIHNFKCPVHIFDDKSYTIVIISSNHVYLVNKETGDNDYKYYNDDDGEIALPHDQSDDTTLFLLRFNWCLDKQKESPKGVPINFDIRKRNHHIEILALVQGKYDYYEINSFGKLCNRELGLDEKPNRTLQKSISQCDIRHISMSLNYGAFQCGYSIWTTAYEVHDIVVFDIRKETGSCGYIINRSTNEVEFYDYNTSISLTQIFQRYKLLRPNVAIKQCSKRLLDLPKGMPINLEFLADNRSSEIILTYDNKFDYYHLNWNGSIRFFKKRLDEITKNQPEDLTEDNETEFKCPYSIVVDDEEYTIIKIADAHFYFIDKLTYEVTSKYYPSYSYCDIEVPRRNSANETQFNSSIEKCVNRRNLVTGSLTAFFNISRISNFIQIIMEYDDKYDYYAINYEGHSCHTDRGLSTENLNKATEEAAEKCNNRRIAWCRRDKFICGLEIFNPENDHYVVLVVRLESGADVYQMDELTNKVHFRQYSGYIYEDDILVRQTELDQNSVYMAEFEECLNLKNSIPTDVSIQFNVTKVSHHINILVYYDGKYDYFEHNLNGKGCFTAFRMENNPTRTLEEQMECDDRGFIGSLKPYTEGYKPQFSCGYEVIKNESFILVLVHSTDRVYEYNIAGPIFAKTISQIFVNFREFSQNFKGSTGKTELYRYDIMSGVTTIGKSETIDEALGYDGQVDKCANRKYLSDFDIPLEVTKKPMPSDDGNNYLEIVVKHQGNYDLYAVEESGYIRYTEMNLREKPQLTLSDYEDKLQCEQIQKECRYVSKTFRCPLKVIENEHYVNISLNAFHYENVYVIDKFTNDTHYFKVKDNLILSNLPIPDAELNYAADVDECINSILTTAEPFPIDVVRNKDFLQIIVTFNRTFDVFESNQSGRQMCAISRGLLEKPSNESKILVEVHPTCVNCEGPAFRYTCPDIVREENENTVNMHFFYKPDFKHSYTFAKSTGELSHNLLRVCSHSNIPAVIKSLVG